MIDTNSGPELAADAGHEQAAAPVMGEIMGEIAALPAASKPQPLPAKEIGGRDGPEPTRFGDWEKAGRCIDF